MIAILVIDDEVPTLAMFRLILEADGYAVLTAENGEEGLRIFEEKRPAIVITDIKMPGMDGLEVLKQIKSAAPETEVIVITGHGDVELAKSSTELEACYFISKPIQIETLDLALKKATESLATGEK